MTTFTLVHLSDLHFSEGSYAHSDHKHSIPHLRAIEERLREIDYDRVIVSGDVSNTGDFNSLDTARRWLTGTINAGNGEHIGLRIDPSKLIVVPGNHDAYNGTTDATLQGRWQQSLTHFNSVFYEHRLREPYHVGYHWLERNNVGVYIATADSCYLGDPDNADAFDVFDQIAKGDVTVKQSKKLLEFYDNGIRGILPHPSDRSIDLDRSVFADSLKILVMHHYVFDPPGKRDYLMSLLDQQRVFSNLALADFDVLLCGHSHIGEHYLTTYGREFDSRAQQRYFLNIFRRHAGIDSLPLQYDDRRGRISRALSALAGLLFVKERRADNPAPVAAMVALLKKGLDDPDSLELEVKGFVDGNIRAGTEEITAIEIEEIRRRLAGIKATDRQRLEAVAEQLIPMIRSLSSRPFLQVMNGSACKATSRGKKRCFNVYRIAKLEKGWRFHTDEYLWDPHESAFPDKPLTREHPFRLYT